MFNGEIILIVQHQVIEAAHEMIDHR